MTSSIDNSTAEPEQVEQVAASQPGNSGLTWQRVSAGNYISDNGYWKLDRQGRGEWWLFCQFQPSRWEPRGDWAHEYGERIYQPFQPKADAMYMADQCEYYEADYRDREGAQCELAKKYVDSLEVTVFPFPPTLVQDAMRHFKFKDPNQPMLGRALAAYVKKELTNYTTLWKAAQKHEAAVLIRGMLHGRVDAEVQKALAVWWAQIGQATYAAA